SAKLGILEEGIDLIIPGGWFSVEHPMTFEDGKIEVQQHICQKNEEITYDETLLEDKDAIIIGSMTYFAPPDHESLKKIIPTQDRDLKISCRSTDSFYPQKEWETTTLCRLPGTKQRHGEKQVPPSANGSSPRTSERGNCFHQIRSTTRMLPNQHTRRG